MDVDLSSEPPRLFEIQVRNRFGGNRRVQVDPSWTVAHLKRLLAASGDDLAPDQQRLVRGGVELEDKRTMADYDLPPPGGLETMVNLEAMHWALFGNMRVFVELPGGDRIALDIGSPWTTIWWVKDAIQEKEEYPSRSNDSPGMPCPLAQRTTSSRTPAPWHITTSGATLS